MQDLSYQYKVPIGFGAVIFLTGVVIFSGLMLKSVSNLKVDISAMSQQMTAMMTAALGPYVQHDSIWDAYKLISTPVKYPAASSIHPETVSVVTTEFEIFVSTAPRRLPISVPLTELGDDYAALDELLRSEPSVATTFERPGGSGLVVAAPIWMEDYVVGHLLFEYPPSPLADQFVSQARDIAIMMAGIMLLLLPIGLMLGRNITRPLTNLANYMTDLDSVSVEDFDSRISVNDDEIGTLGKQFRKMLLDLQHTRALEKSIVRSDRLAALGRLVAGIAHEVNNPLAGMLTAVNTYHKKASDGNAARNTIDLLERGLEQIRHTVSALIVETRVDSAPFSRQDVDDILTLIRPEIRRKAIRSVWQNNISSSVALPSSPVRQVMLNLALNAVKASPHGGSLDFRVGTLHGILTILIRNEGHLSEDKLERLFEPFVSYDQSGTGLGLWVTYQIVSQLGGEIRVTSPDDFVIVEVDLPIQEVA